MKKLIHKITAPDYPIQGRGALVTFELFFFLFLVCGFIGFVYEEIYFLIADGHLSYRGFLYGPILPVYAFGGVGIYLLFNRFRKYPPVVFFGAMLLTGVLEFLTGWTMWNLFHQHWWDYTNKPLNIAGYVCLESVLSFAIAGLLLIYIIAPRLLKAADHMSEKKRNILFAVLALIFVADVILSFVVPNPLGIR